MVYRPPDPIEQEQTPLSAVPIQYQTDEGLDEVFVPEQPPEEPKRPGMISRIFAKREEVEDEDEDLEDVVGLSEEDRDYLFGGTEDEMISHPKEDFVSLTPDVREFLFGTGGGSTSRPDQSTIKDLVEVDKETREYLTGTGRRPTPKYEVGMGKGRRKSKSKSKRRRPSNQTLTTPL